MPTGRRGRLYQVPTDTVSLRSATVDVNSRIGWLLLMSRLHHSDPEMALGVRFNQELAKAGVLADRSAVSRWEAGKAMPKWSVLSAYERVLGLAPGQISSVVNALRRAYLGNKRAVGPMLDPSSVAFQHHLDVLFNRLLGGEATGRDWTDFGHHVASSDVIYVHSTLWQEITTRLVSDMARSVRLAYLQRFEAVRILLDHRVAHPWVLRATGDYLSDPAVQVINDPVGVLEISRAPEAGEVLLEKFARTSSEDVFQACATALAYKVETGQYDEDKLKWIESALADMLRTRHFEMTGVEELVMVMPEAAQARLMREARGLAPHRRLETVAAHGEWVRPDTARQVAQHLADAATARMPGAESYDADPMTPRLIRESLFSARSDHRHYASLALQGSPFRATVSAAVVDRLAEIGLSDPLAPRLARLLRYLAGPEHETRVLSWLCAAPAGVARELALTIGHLPASDADLSVLVQRLTGDRSLLDRALLYGLGMRCDAALEAIAAADDRPTTLREAAGWWHRQGGALLR